MLEVVLRMPLSHLLAALELWLVIVLALLLLLLSFVEVQLLVLGFL